MTHPTHGLDPNALEALRNELEGEYGEKVIGKQTLYWLVTACLAALSQNPGTSNTSGEAVGVRGLEWSRDDVGNDVATTICGPYVVWTEGIGAVGYWSLGYGGVRTQAPDRAAAKAAAQADYEQRILAALEPRASDRERTIEKCAVMLDDIAALCSSAAGREKEGTTTKFRLKLRARNFTEAAAAIRKLSEVSHE